MDRLKPWAILAAIFSIGASSGTLRLSGSVPSRYEIALTAFEGSRKAASGAPEDAITSDLLVVGELSVQANDDKTLGMVVSVTSKNGGKLQNEQGHSPVSYELWIDTAHLAFEHALSGFDTKAARTISIRVPNVQPSQLARSPLRDTVVFSVAAM